MGVNKEPRDILAGLNGITQFERLRDAIRPDGVVDRVEGRLIHVVIPPGGEHEEGGVVRTARLEEGNTRVTAALGGPFETFRTVRHDLVARNADVADLTGVAVEGVDQTQGEFAVLALHKGFAVIIDHVLDKSGFIRGAERVYVVVISGAVFIRPITGKVESAKTIFIGEGDQVTADRLVLLILVLILILLLILLLLLLNGFGRGDRGQGRIGSRFSTI